MLHFVSNAYALLITPLRTIITRSFFITSADTGELVMAIDPANNEPVIKVKNTVFFTEINAK